jgi:hypothetical protein
MSVERLSSLTPEQLRRRRRLTLEVLWVCTIALVPWAVYLGIALPHEYSTRHWDLAWSGFDGLEILALGATAYYGWRGRQALVATALAAATLLICDAWFDVSLDLGTPAIWTSLASAVFLELPLAFFLIHRVRLLLRITLLHLFPEGDAQGRPMSLTRLPLLATLTEPFARPGPDDQTSEKDAARGGEDEYDGVRKAGGDGVPGEGGAGGEGGARQRERRSGEPGQP